ncbi:MAG: hypothetical protein K6F83_02865 [Clostridiales bacterium]|nr:hypothetical protein [Clostridiales bacterium]
MADKKKTRRWVIRAIVAFLVVMLLLTFFSNTIMNATIPKVVAEYSQWGNLSFTNSAKGYIQCDNKTQYKVPKGLEGRKIHKIDYDTYDYVVKGTPVITLSEIEDKTEYETLLDSYDELKKQMDYAARTPKDDNSTIFKDTVDQAQETVNKANATLNDAQQKDSKISEANSVINTKQTELTIVEAEIEANAQQVEDLNTLISSYDSQIADLQAQIEKLKSEPASTPTPAANEGGEGSEGEEGTEPTETTAPSNGNEQKIKELEDKIAEIESKKNEAEGNLSAASDRLASYSAKKTELSSAIADAQTVIAEQEMVPSVDEAKKQVTEANKQLDKAKKDLNNQNILDGIQAEKDTDSYTKQIKQLEDYEKKIAEYEKNMSIVTIEAPANGSLYDLSVAEGDVIHEGDVLFSVLPDADQMECSVEFNFETEKTQGFYTGMELTPDNSWVRSVRITSIKPDKNAPRTNRIVKCKVEGDYIFPGDEITVIAGKSNKNYENIVPSSAVITDNSGTFVYALVEKSTPLGTKYTVKKIMVDIEDTDGARTAIKGEKLDSKYQYVTRSEEPLKDGDRVRLQDYSKKE